MIIYEDVITGAEIVSDSYDLKEIDGVVFEVDCAMITEGAVNVDTGANASAEEAEEDVDDQAVRVNNVVHSFRLQERGGQGSMKKKVYQDVLKEYFKNVKKYLEENGSTPEEIKAFQTGAQQYYVKKIAPNFGDFEFYSGDSDNPDGMLLLLNYREDGTTPYFIIWKHGLKAVKV